MSRRKEKYMTFSVKQSKEKGIKPGLPLVFIEKYHVLNNSLSNIAKNLGESNFYHLSRKFNADVLDLLKSHDFFTMATEIALKN